MYRQRGATMRQTQDSMAIVTAHPIRKPATAKACMHSRLIDDVLSAGGERIGKVRCLECRTVIDDPHQSEYAEQEVSVSQT